MYTSKYNWIVENEGTMFVYNNMSGAIAQIEKKNKQQIKDIFAETGAIDNNIYDQNILNELQHCKFLVEDNESELAFLEQLYKKNKSSKHRKSITVAITHECNMSCVYCYQCNGTTPINGHISNTTIESLIEYVQKIPTNTSIVLYGGEPLLYPEECLEITNRCKDLHNSLGLKYKASIVTNGTLLTEELAEKLSMGGVVHAQVTIDGPRDIHDGMRPYSNKKGSFDSIMQNIRAASKHLRISVRVNVSREFSTFDKQFLKELDGISSMIRVHVAPVRNDKKDQLCIGRTVYEINRDHMMDKYASDFRLYKLSARASGCGATSLSGFVMDYDGGIYKCWSDIGSKSGSIGNIGDDISLLGKKLENEQIRWNAFNPYIRKPCSDCKMLPTCGGGCPEAFLLKGKPRCEFTKKQYQDLIQHRIVQYATMHRSEAK